MLHLTPDSWIFSGGREFCFPTQTAHVFQHLRALRKLLFAVSLASVISYTEVRTKLCGGNIYFFSVSRKHCERIYFCLSAGFAPTLGCAETWGKAGFAQNG
jgi:hypothetical protein